MEIIVTDQNSGRKYKLRPDNGGMCFQLWRTSDTEKGKKAKNGHEVKNEWQFTGKYPTSVCDGLSCIYKMMELDSSDGVIIELGNDISKLDKYIKNKMKQIADSIELKED